MGNIVFANVVYLFLELDFILYANKLYTVDPLAIIALLEKVVDCLEHKYNTDRFPYIEAEEAMQLYRVTSVNSLKKYCEEGQVRVSDLSPKKVLYNREDILKHIESKLRKS